MKVEVKNVKINNVMSEETLCFSASVYIDGKRAGEVCNRGHGGCNNYHWFDRELGKKFVKFANEQDTEFDFEKDDHLIGELVDDYEEQKEVRGWCRKQTVFRLKGEEKGAYRTLTVKYGEKAKKYIEDKYGDKVDEIVNERFVKPVKPPMNDPHAVEVEQA